ncbi:hypothetical protein HCA69_15645 [Listeria grandensis]|uniref:Uncharacterized protein n=1 Tax=Listeria grandensis TaxID=1494963 RepID=A0A7X0Y6T5_9LIST|nr:hypothetical protein [Listeria grandensis]MBC1937803.1 hypothetical protein [Listeria grandensis]
MMNQDSENAYHHLKKTLATRPIHLADTSILGAENNPFMQEIEHLNKTTNKAHESAWMVEVDNN